jgi:hypothetical protein
MKIGTVTGLVVISTIVLFAASAYAQDAGGMGGMGGMGGGGRHRQQQQKKDAETAKPKVDDKAYNAALKELPDKQYDAWHGVR